MKDNIFTLKRDKSYIIEGCEIVKTTLKEDTITVEVKPSSNENIIFKNDKFVREERT